ncbi:DNA-3-methyladenine glycosylase I [Thiotrichales bacterium 19S9-12]|nr:DNA-3-methyladenine glycosylase I [Thiotrichales bacterium 19S9-11]MCF6811453.1 DNA-3-methyladenine glycosylase I [Thiotrichales bacterium 19S9-12]
MVNNLSRCFWVTDDPLYIDYHDNEWGIPLKDEQRLFELLILEGMQAGLSWITILKRRNAYRKAFDHFDAEKIVKYDDHKRLSLLNDKTIIRNRLKIDAIIKNAKAYLVLKEQMSFSDYLWSFVDGNPKINYWQHKDKVPAETETSKAMSKDLKVKGFSFVGPTICYAFMQACGMVNDHTVDCFRHKELLS